MKKMSAGKVLAIFFVSLSAVVLIGFVALWILFPPSKIKALVVTQVEKKIAREVTIGKAGVTLYPFIGFSLSDVVIANTDREGFSQESFLSFDRFLIEISIGSLLKKQPEIKKVIIKRPHILIEKDTAGSFNFSDLMVSNNDTATTGEDTVAHDAGEPQGGTKTPALPVPITLSLFKIEDGQIMYRDARSKQSIVIGNFNDRIDFSIDRELKNIITHGELSCSEVSLKTATITKPLSNLSVSLNHDIGANIVAGTVAVKTLRLSFQKVFLNMAGTISSLNDTPQFDLKIQSDAIALQDLIGEIPVELVPVLSKMTASGSLMLALNVNGAFEKGTALPVSGTVAIENGKFKHSDLPKAVEQIVLNCSFTDNSLDVTSLKLRCADNPIALKAKVRNFKKPLVDVKLLADLNLNDIKDFAVLPAGVALSGKVFADIAAQGEVDAADPARIAAKGTLDLANVSVLAPPLTKPAVMNGQFVLSSQAIAEQLSVVIGRSSMKMNARIQNYLSLIVTDSTNTALRPNLTFAVTSSLLDIDEFMPPKEKAKKKKSDLQEGGSDGAKGKQEGDTTKGESKPPIMDISGSINAATIIYNNVEMKNAKVSLSMVNNVTDLTVTSGFAQGSIKEKLHRDSRIKGTTAFTNSLELNNVEIKDLCRNITGFLSPDSKSYKVVNKLPEILLGKLTLNSAIKGSGAGKDAILESLIGDVSLKMANGTIPNSVIINRLSEAIQKFITIDDIKFKDLTAALHIQNKNVLIQKLQLFSDVGDWNVGGTIGFNKELALDVANRLTKAHSAPIITLQNSGKDALKGLLSKVNLPQNAVSYLDNNGVPADKDGRITLLLSLSGPATAPKASFNGFGKGSATATATSNGSVKQQVVKEITKAVDNAKLEAQKRLEEERRKLEAQRVEKEAALKREIEEQKRIAAEKQKKLQESIKSSAKDKLKKLF